MIDISDTELFKDLTTLEVDKVMLDLRNDYVYYDVKYGQDKSLVISFRKIGSTFDDPQVFLIFKRVLITSFILSFPFSEEENKLNSFYRGRFEEEGELLEFSKNDQRYFNLEFKGGDKINVFAAQAYFSEV